jgi:aldose 1-epimerase
VSDGAEKTTVTVSSFGALPDGTAVDRYRLDDGIASIAILTYGGIIQELWAPDRDGRRTDVVLGFDDVIGYLGAQPFHGAIIGRYANRIAGASFDLEGVTYPLEANHGRHHLHGGSHGFNTRVWDAEELPGRGVRLRLTSPDGDAGYPARLDVTVDYTLSGGALTIDYAATNAEPAGGLSTVVNLTNHTYFQLAGHAAGSVGDHVLEVPADRFVASDPDLIPTGEIVPVEGTPLDLRAPRALAAGWEADHEAIRNGGGYDHTWVLDGVTPGTPVLAARVVEPGSGRVLEVHTDQPGSHVYSGNMMEPLFAGKGGRRYGWREALCLETQHFTDSPHHPAFPSTVVAAGTTHRTTTRFTFSAE